MSLGPSESPGAGWSLLRVVAPLLDSEPRKGAGPDSDRAVRLGGDWIVPRLRPRSDAANAVRLDTDAGHPPLVNCCSNSTCPRRCRRYCCQAAAPVPALALNPVLVQSGQAPRCCQ